MKRRVRLILAISLLIAEAIIGIAFLVAKAITAERNESRVDDQSAATDDLRDSDAFDSIVLFWHTTYPDAKFENSVGVHLSDGVDGSRLHVNVPVALETLYVHQFEETFLRAQLADTDGLRRKVANDLLLVLKQGRFKGAGRCQVSYDGIKYVDCLDYIVRVP
jgi:hypothetical protein